MLFPGARGADTGVLQQSPRCQVKPQPALVLQASPVVDGCQGEAARVALGHDAGRITARRGCRHEFVCAGAV